MWSSFWGQLYLGTVEGIDAIFFTNTQKQEYFEPGGVEKTSPHIGELQKVDDIGHHPFDFKKLVNPRRISLNISSAIQAVNSVKLNNPKTILYLSLTLEEKTSSQYPDKLVNRVYQISLSNLTSKEVWSNEVGSNKYMGKGIVFINQIADDKFVLMLLGDCYACDHTPTKAIIVNLATRNEKYLENKGNFEFNLKHNTFSYRNLSSVQEPCEVSPGCDNGQRTVMKATNQVYSDNLP